MAMKRSSVLPSEDGSIAVPSAVIVTVAIGFAALAIDQLPPGATPDSMRITARGDAPSALAPLLGPFGATIDGTSVSVASQANKCVMLVLDRSGSMDDDSSEFYTNKSIQAGMYKLSDPGADAYFYHPDVGVIRTLDQWLFMPAGVLYAARWNGHDWDLTARQAHGPAQPLTDVKNAAVQFVDILDLANDKCGLVSYSSAASVDRPLSQDRDAVVNSVWQFPPGGYTNIGQGLACAVSELASPRALGCCRKVVVLLSDGIANVDENGSYSTSDGRAYALAAAESATQSSVLVFTISAGSGADRSLMQQIAHMTGGAEYFASKGGELPDIFAEILERVPSQLTSI